MRSNQLHMAVQIWRNMAVEDRNCCFLRPQKWKITKKVKNIKTRLDVLDNKKIRRGLSLAIVLNNRQTGSISLRCLSPSVPRTKENIPAGIQFCDWTEKRYVWAAIIGFSGEFNIQISGKLKRRWFMDAQSCCRVPKLISSRVIISTFSLLSYRTPIIS